MTDEAARTLRRSGRKRAEAEASAARDDGANKQTKREGGSNGVVKGECDSGDDKETLEKGSTVRKPSVAAKNKARITTKKKVVTAAAVKVEEKEDGCVIVDFRPGTSSARGSSAQWTVPPSEGSKLGKSELLTAKEEDEKITKRQKGKAKGKGIDEDDERRASFRPAPSKAVRDRIHRVQMQRMFLVHRSGASEEEQDGGSKGKKRMASDALDPEETFKVAGSTGNVYTVTIGRRPSCDCPDSSVVCKHILFVFLKVLGVASSSHVYYQAELTRRELREVFSTAKADPTVSDPALSQAYLTSIGKSSAVAASAKEAKMPDEGDTCPVCYEDFKPSQREDLVFCETSCGKPLHRACSEQWSLCRRQANLPMSCVWCRAEIPSTFSDEDGGRYLNLAGPARLPTERDWSIYSPFAQRAIYRRGFF